MHWAINYMGLPYAEGATGPAAFDCWGLVRAVQREQFGRELPVIQPGQYDALALARQFRDDPERRRWVQTDVPIEGAIVLMSHGRRPHHCGIWLETDGGRVLHAERPHGVAAPGLAQLRMAGWGAISYWVPA